jgi:hypothetical protein
MASTEPTGDDGRRDENPPTLEDFLNWLIDITIVLIAIVMFVIGGAYIFPPKPLSPEQIAAQDEIYNKLLCTGGFSWRPTEEQIKSGLCNKYR